MLTTCETLVGALVFYMLESFFLTGAAAENDDSAFSVADLGILSAYLSHFLLGNDTGCPGWDVSRQF